MNLCDRPLDHFRIVKNRIRNLFKLLNFQYLEHLDLVSRINFNNLINFLYRRQHPKDSESPGAEDIPRDLGLGKKMSGRLQNDKQTKCGKHSSRSDFTRQTEYVNKSQAKNLAPQVTFAALFEKRQIHKTTLLLMPDVCF